MNLLPDGIFAQHVAILGKTRSGKSSVMRLMAESLLDQGKPVCIIDPKGDWWGLKAGGEGRKTGYPVVIFGGSHADVPINAHAGASVTELVATGNRPCIIDLGGWMVADRTRFFIDFASKIFILTKGMRWLFIDEVHNFAPQGKIMDPEAGKMLHWANRLASEGLGKGLAIVSASQRPQKVHKDFLTCAETLIAMRVIHPLDRGAVRDWVDGAGDPAKGREVLDSLASMARGEGWIWSPEIGFGPKRLQFPMFTTFDSFKPHVGKGDVKLQGWADVDIEEVKSKLAGAIEAAKANDPRELKRKIAELERQVNATQAAPVQLKPKTVTKSVEKPIFKEFQVKRLESAAEKLEKVANEAVERVRIVAVEAQGTSKEIIDLLRATMAKISAPQSIPPPHPVAHTPRGVPPLITRPPKAVRFTPPAEGDEDTFLASKCERALMIALAQHPEGLTKAQIITYAGYQPNGSISDAFAKFTRNGWMVPGGAGFVASPSGVDVLGPYDPLPRGEELRQKMINEAGTCGGKLLSVLFENYPNPLSKAQIIEAAGYKANGSISDEFAKFTRLQWMVKQGGGFRAGDMLFKE